MDSRQKVLGLGDTEIKAQWYSFVGLHFSAEEIEYSEILSELCAFPQGERNYFHEPTKQGKKLPPKRGYYRR